MVGKGNLAVLESSNISETGEAIPTKIDVHALDINPFCMNFLSRFQSIEFFNVHGLYSPWSEREIWPFWKVAISPKPEKPHPPKLVYMHLISIPTCMNFLSRFQFIEFFDDHGL